MPRLKMLRGPNPGELYELKKEIITIGRGRKNEIVIHDNEVSREHSRLVRVLEDYEIHDLGSRNGIFVDGHAIGDSGWLLHNNAIIEMGVSITFEYISETSGESTDNMAPVGMAANTVVNTILLEIKLQSQNEPQLYPLDAEDIKLGRDITNDIVIQEAEVSREHIQLTYTNDGYVIEDMGSTNGTMVNGKLLGSRSHLLDPEDIITIGTTVEMRYVHEQLHQRSELRTEVLPATYHESQDSTHPTRRRLQEATAYQGGKHGLSPEQLSEHVFLAYARDDWQDIVGHLFAFLEDRNMPVWVDQYLQEDSDVWHVAIDQAMSECMCLIVVAAPHALHVPYIKRSIRHFLNREKPIVLLQTGQVDRSPMGLQRVPTIYYDEADPAHSFSGVLAHVKRLTGS